MANVGIYQLTDTWNSGATTFNGIKIDVTDTTSAADSKLLDLQIGSVSQFSVGKDGTVVTAGALTATGITSTTTIASTGNINGASPTEMGYLSGVTSGIQAQFNALSPGAFTADGDTLITPTTPLVLDQATGDEAALTLDYTVNKATSGNDTGLLVNMTDTASPGISNLMDLQVGGASKFSVDKDGYIPVLFVDAFNGNGFKLLAGRLRMGQNVILTWHATQTSSAVELELRKDAANTLGQRNSTNAQTFNIYNTYTDASNYERGFLKWDSNAFIIGTEAAGTGTARPIVFAPNGVSPETLKVALESSQFRIDSLPNGGTQRGIFFRLGGTNWLGLATTGNYSYKKTFLLDDIEHSGTNIGLYSATPVAQAAHIADPTGGATTDAEARTAINAILVALENIGITAVA